MDLIDLLEGQRPSAEFIEGGPEIRQTRCPIMANIRGELNASFADEYETNSWPLRR